MFLTALGQFLPNLLVSANPIFKSSTFFVVLSVEVEMSKWALWISAARETLESCNIWCLQCLSTFHVLTKLSTVSYIHLSEASDRCSREWIFLWIHWIKLIFVELSSVEIFNNIWNFSVLGCLLNIFFCAKAFVPGRHIFSIKMNLWQLVLDVITECICIAHVLSHTYNKIYYKPQIIVYINNTCKNRHFCRLYIYASTYYKPEYTPACQKWRTECSHVTEES